MTGSQTTEGPVINEKKTLVRLTSYFRKKQGLSDEEFHKYWAETHGPLFTQLPVVKEKLVKYNQFHLSPEFKEKFSILGADNWISDYDGAADFWAKDVESLMAVFTDKEFLAFSEEDTKNLIEGSVKSVIGYDHVQFDCTS